MTTILFWSRIYYIKFWIEKYTEIDESNFKNVSRDWNKYILFLSQTISENMIHIWMGKVHRHLWNSFWERFQRLKYDYNHILVSQIPKNVQESFNDRVIYRDVFVE